MPYEVATVVDADTARVTQFKVKRFQTYGVLKNKQLQTKFRAEMKAQRDEGTGRILLGDNTGAGQSCYRRSISIVSAF